MEVFGAVILFFFYIPISYFNNRRFFIWGLMKYIAVSSVNSSNSTFYSSIMCGSRHTISTATLCTHTEENVNNITHTITLLIIKVHEFLFHSIGFLKSFVRTTQSLQFALCEAPPSWAHATENNGLTGHRWYHIFCKCQAKLALHDLHSGRIAVLFTLHNMLSHKS